MGRRRSSRVGQDEGLRLVVFGQTSVTHAAIAIAIAVLQKVDRPLLDGLMEPSTPHDEEQDERDRDGPDDAADDTADNRADVGTTAAGDTMRLCN